MRTDDRLDEGFELLRACSREQAPFDLDLEERMMKEFSNANRNWIPRFGKTAAVVLLCVTVAGAAVAGTGGFDWIWDSLTLTADEYDAESGEILDGDELGHELMHKDEEKRSRQVAETEAEAVAFVVSHVAGLDAVQASADYIHLYRGDSATLWGSLERIQKASAELIRCLNAGESYRQAA